MKVFIQGLGNISPQHTFTSHTVLKEAVAYSGNFLSCMEPPYKEYIDAGASRRMGRLIKMGVAASLECLKDAGVGQPDAIITGTGLGCVQDTEKFLTAILENDEELLTPTSFIQSTHNTVSGQIALMLKCTGYNFTYVHRGFSFESSLLDAMMQLREGESHHVLVGGIDEMTPHTFTILQRLGHWKRQAISSLRLLESTSKGTIAGEGAAFFLLSNQAEANAYAEVSAVTTFYKPDGYDSIENTIQGFLEDAGVGIEKIDLVLLGLNGDEAFDGIYHHLRQSYMKETACAYFKHLCGEYHTASAFALWLAATSIRHQSIPDFIKLDECTHRPLRHVLIYNHYRNTNHALFLLKQC